MTRWLDTVQELSHDFMGHSEFVVLTAALRDDGMHLRGILTLAQGIRCAVLKFQETSVVV